MKTATEEWEDETIMIAAETPRRVTTLQNAIKHTNGARNIEYGAPYDNMTASAVMQTAYIIAKYRGKTIDEQDFCLSAEDACWLMVITKISRTFAGQVKPDTYEDAAAYSAMAAECAEIEASD